LSYQNGLTQFNQGSLTSAAFQQLGNAPSTSFATQAAIVAAYRYQFPYSSPSSFGGKFPDAFGVIQTISTLRFQNLSINYTVPPDFSERLRIPHMSVAIQGSNLGLHSNYRGIDPNVNAFSTGNYTSDFGQIPQPRIWSCTVRLGN
jgi:hypothetical protein